MRTDINLDERPFVTAFSLDTLRISLFCGLMACADGVQAHTGSVSDSVSLHATGTQVLLRLNLGRAVSGIQSESGLVNDKGDEAKTNKVAFYLGARYFPVALIGLELETGYMRGSASAPDSKAMDLTDAWSTNLGVSLVPWQLPSFNGLLQAALSGGLNFTRLTLAEEFREFESDFFGFTLTEEAATGFGWYGGADLRFIDRSGFLLEGGVRYSQEFPKFPKGEKAFSGSNILFDIAFGYCF